MSVESLAIFVAVGIIAGWLAEKIFKIPDLGWWVILLSVLLVR